jgi:hypothetical protein
MTAVAPVIQARRRYLDVDASEIAPVWTRQCVSRVLQDIEWHGRTYERLSDEAADGPSKPYETCSLLR